MTAPTGRSTAGAPGPVLPGEPGLSVSPGGGPGPGSPPTPAAPALARGHGAAGPDPLELLVLGSPAPQGSKHGRPIYKGRGEHKVFTGKVAMVESSKEKVLSWREAVKASAQRRLEAWSIETYGGTGQAGLFRIVDQPVTVEIDFCFDKPKSAPKRRRIWPITRSTHDVDKLQRSTFDALTDAGVFKDDSQVVDVRARKFHTDDPASPLRVPGARIRVYAITPEGTL